MSLLIIEIAFAFEIDVGVAGQIFTAQSIASATMSLLMAAISVRYSHKSLLLVGLVVLCVSALGCAVSPSFGLLLIAYSVMGLSFTMIRPMSQALIGSLFTIQERPKMLGYLLAGFAIAYVVGPHIINFIGDWRLALLLFMFPLTLVSFILAFRGIPSVPSGTPLRQQLLHGIRAVLQHRSALACVTANVLFGLVIRVIHFYGIPFYREHFLLDTTSASVLVTVISLGYVIGGLVGGRVVNRFGRKPLTILSMLLVGVQTLTFINVPSLWLSLVVWLPSGFMMSAKNSGFDSLALEQVSTYRGTMMSLTQFSTNVAEAIGSGLSGLILVTYGYGPMGILGIGAIIAAIIVHFFTIDPTKRQQAKPELRGGER
jgi:predicted MFS family arabinose efflux permease